MKIILKIGIILSVLTAISACDSYRTHGKFLTEHKEAWFDGYVPGGQPTFSDIDREEESDKGLVFCQANVNEDGEASPVCYRPKFTGKRR